MLNGKGFVKGTDATKAVLVWNDTNEDGKVSTRRDCRRPAASPSPSYSFDRWAVSADLQLRLKTPAGFTKLYGEVQLGSNMDRALFIANPTIGGQELASLATTLAFCKTSPPMGWWVSHRLLRPQCRLSRLSIGQSDSAFRSDAHVLAPSRPRLPGRARFVFQYDFVRDHLGRTATGLPTDLKNDQWTLRLQGEL